MVAIKILIYAYILWLMPKLKVKNVTDVSK